MIKQFIKVIEKIYEEDIVTLYMPDKLFVAEQLLSIIRQLAEQEEEIIYGELAVETLDSVIENIKKYHDIEDIVEMLEVNINELNEEAERRYS